MILSLDEIHPAPIKAEPRDKEVAILSMSHMSGLKNENIDQLAKSIEYFIGNAAISVDASTPIDETQIKDFTADGKQLVIILAPDTGEAMNSVLQYAYDSYPYFWSNSIHYRPWHHERVLGLPYYQKVN